jgi:hypothetical protein
VRFSRGGGGGLREIEEGMFLGDGSLRDMGALSSGLVWDHVVGRRPSTESALFLLPADAVALPAVGFKGGKGKGSLAVYCGSGVAKGLVNGELLVVEVARVELPLLVLPLRPFLGRMKTSCVSLELLPGTLATVGPVTLCRDPLCFFFSGSGFGLVMRCTCICDWLSRTYSWFMDSIASLLLASLKLVNDL